ncbi:ribosomal protein l47 mitochondrial-related [Holotrichia oblita]|uniref:Ribosomal protein l47 mitochondrial-related n=1 Tax=Holotrichia oblita TaxID=644536 RepID=A0ACB9TEL1_HOLOL|nr:ribosomal protein l47 mitochondrial-related [Holotrichia oblita]
MIKENILLPIRSISITAQRNDLMEFFDDKKNWGAQEVKTGRSWKLEELRIKSNSDLHKLWYILLKEKNMLLTMEHESNENMVLFPSPERLDKVEESMENLEAVVRERNKAYHLLETGENGERPEKITNNAFGLPHVYKESEYAIPKHMNEEWLQKDSYRASGKDLKEFFLKYKEKIFVENKKSKRRNFNHVCGLLKRFPNMDMEALKQQYPDVDIEKAKNCKRSRGHFVPT